MVVDTSTLISLARAGLLGVLDRSPLAIVLLDVVWQEAVVAGDAGGHADAAAIASALAGRERQPAPTAPTVDGAVLAAGRLDGFLATNDLALGRRARNVGVAWLRTADLVVLAARSGLSSSEEARNGIVALLAAGRITPQLANDYLEDL